MAPIFVSADMAALVAAYRPPTPTKDRPSLVPGRRLSDEYLLDSRRIIKQFRTILETDQSRLALSDLPSRLDIDNFEWLLACYDDPLLFSREGRGILSMAECTRILQEALDSTGLRTIDAASFASRHDLSKSTLRSLLEGPFGQRQLHWWDHESTRTSHIYSDTFVQALNGYLSTITTSTYAETEYVEGVDLCSRFPHVPAGLLLQLAKAFAAQTSAMPSPGEWQVLNGRTVFIPERHAKDLESKKMAARRAQIEHSINDIATRGFCKVDESDILVDVRRQYTAQRPEHIGEGGLVELGQENDVTANTYTYLVRSTELDEAMKSLHIAAPQETARVWHARDGSENNTKLIAAVFKSLIEETHRELQGAMLRSEMCRPEVEKMIVAALEQHTTQDADSFEKILLERLVVLVQLYTQGVANASDDTLKQHLDEFVGDYFRRDVLPPVTSTLQENRLLLDKSRKKDYDKMSEAVTQAKTLPDVQVAITKLARKQKFKQSAADDLAQAKRTILEQKARQLRNKKISRGSDVLQNLIWILLAEKTEGLYVSAGKDTTRMIKLYSIVASTKDAGAAEKLAEWRDALKAGKEDQSMLEEMRRLAIESVARWCAAHEAQPSTEEIG